MELYLCTTIANWDSISYMEGFNGLGFRIGVLRGSIYTNAEDGLHATSPLYQPCEKKISSRIWWQNPTTTTFSSRILVH